MRFKTLVRSVGCFVLAVALNIISIHHAAARCTQLTDATGSNVDESRWIVQPSHHRAPQAFWPSDSSHARDIFYVTIENLKNLFTHFTPNDWDKGSITKRLTGPQTAPTLTLNIALRFVAGIIPINVRGVIPAELSSCPLNFNNTPTPGRRIQFDMRNATGEFEGVIDGLRFDFRVQNTTNNEIIVTSNVGVLPGPRYGSRGSDEAALLMRHQIWPVMDAIRTYYQQLQSSHAHP